MSRNARAATLTAVVALAAVAAAAGWFSTRHEQQPPHHLALERPDFTLTTGRSGRWSDPATWSEGRVPRGDDVIEVRHEVTFDGRSEAGSIWAVAPIRFDDARDTELTLSGSLVIDDGGLVEVGTAERPLPEDIRAAIRFRVADERAFAGGFRFVPEDTGIWVLDGGRLELHGAPVARTWSKLLEPARAGARTITAAEDLSDWPAGEAVLAGTGDVKEPEHEVVQVRRVEPLPDGGSRIHLGRPLRFAHVATERMAGEVGLLEHNVSVSSVDPDDRAHVFFAAGGGGGLSHTRFEHMGPRDVFSRYALHFHMMGETSRGIEVRGNSFRGAGRYWLNVHGSNGIEVVDNVGYQARGAGFYMEHPAGFDNVWLHNLGIDVAPSANLAHRNSVFWFLQGNALVDNVGVGARGGADSSGIFIPAQQRDDPALRRRTVILHNEAHHNQRHGLASWLNLSPQFHVVDMRLWRNGKSGFHWGAYGTRFRAYRIEAFDNGKMDVEARVKNLYLQDSLLQGSPTGMYFANPVVSTNPEHFSEVVRTRFEDHEHDVRIDDRRECKKEDRTRCSAMFLEFVQPMLGSEQPVRFGWQWNEETQLRFRAARAAARPDLPPTFTLRRPDLARPSPDAFRDESIGAWVVRDPADPGDLPPAVSRPSARPLEDGGFVFRSEVEDDGTVESVEFLVNGVPVGSVGRGGAVRLPWDAGDLLAWAFLTVRATDDAGNVTYSETLQVAEPVR